MPRFDLIMWPEVRKPNWAEWISLKVKRAPLAVECLDTKILAKSATELCTIALPTLLPMSQNTALLTGMTTISLILSLDVLPVDLAYTIHRCSASLE